TRVLERLLGRATEAQVGVMQLNVRRWQEFYPSAGGAPLWAELLAEGDGGTARAAEASELLQALKSAEPAKRLDMLESYLSEQVAHVLRLGSERLERRTPFSS